MNENRISNVCVKVEAEERINEEEALSLLQEEDFLALGQLAQERLLKFHSPNQVSFCIDRNINYTNICESKCRFCAFYRLKDDTQAYLLNADDICHNRLPSQTLLYFHKLKFWDRFYGTYLFCHLIIFIQACLKTFIKIKF